MVNRHCLNRLCYALSRDISRVSNYHPLHVKVHLAKHAAVLSTELPIFPCVGVRLAKHAAVPKLLLAYSSKVINEVSSRGN